MMASQSAKLIRSQRPLCSSSAPLVAAVGTFDGLHRGHQTLFDVLRAEKRRIGGRALIVSFYPHPAVGLGRVSRMPRIITLRQKLEILGLQDIDFLFMIRFDKNLAQLSAQTFLDRYLFSLPGFTSLIIGPDATIGRAREGTPQVMAELTRAAGFKALDVPQLESGGKKISSRDIRAAIGNGDMRLAAELLGREYLIEGRVIHGDGRGRSIGFRTANVYTPRCVVPRYGVYRAWAHLDGKRYQAVVNVGLRPTFGTPRETIEAHLLDYQGPEFYDARIGIEFLERLRDEKKFGSVAELIAAITADCQRARESFHK